MLPKQQRYTLYVLLLILVSVVGTTAIANSKVRTLFAEVSLVVEQVVTVSTPKNTRVQLSETSVLTAEVAPTSMFTTIIQGADEEVGCSNQGFSIARFNLCGDFDDRIISLAGSYGSVSWQRLGGSCTPNINEDCPNTGSCYTQISTGPTLTLDASAVPSTSGAEYRVIADGQTYYFKVKKSTITQSYVKQDFICGVDGRIQITNLSSAYEFSIDSGSGFGPWQGPIFPNLGAGTYNVKARLRDTPNTCEYPYEPITIAQRDIEITATFTDALCNGDTGSITVTAANVPGPYKYTLLNSSGVAQEFSAFVSDNPYTFSAVGFGTYTVQVETQQCTGDPLNGITPPRQNLDINGNPLTIGAGASALDASTEVNSSFGCDDINSVDITLNASGGSAPYTFRVNGGPVQPAFGNATTDAGTTTYTVTSAGTYDFVITDSNGCTITASSDVKTLLPPDVTVNGIDGTCSNGGAKLNFVINNGRGYNLSFRESALGPWVTTPQISVAAGTYTDLEVRYQQGGFECTLDLPTVTVTNVGTLMGSATKVSDVTCLSGGGTTGGQIDFNGPFTGGSGSGYEFSIDGINFSTTTSYTNLLAGIYTPIIRDAGGCRLELTSIEIEDIDPPTNLDFAQSNISCAAGTSDVALTPTSNAAINRYEILSPSYFDNGTNDTFTGLLTSTAYIFQITDINGCSYTEGFRPVETSSIRARVRSGGDLKVCTMASDGSGSFLIDGFANNYTYAINGGPESAPQNNGQIDLTGLGVGTYTIVVTDADSGCTDTASFDILEPAAPLLLSGTVTDMTCANNNLGRVVANATGGWGTFRYTLTPPSGPVQGPKSGNSFGNLSVSGTYTLSVTDAEGCTVSSDFDLTEIDSPGISLDTAASDFCYVPGTGATIAVTSTAGTAPLTGHQYRINGGALQPTPSFTGIAPGTYTVEVVDGNGCRDAISVTVEPQLRVTVSLNTEIPCGGAPGSLDVQVSGGHTSGAGPKMYEVSADNGTTWDPSTPLTSTSFTYSTTSAGTYLFRVTDNEGCMAESSPFVLDPPLAIDPANAQVFPPACGEVNSGRAIITPDATSGVAPYEISFDGGPWTSNTLYSGLVQGQTYSYQVRDARGCLTAIENLTIPAPGTAPNATITATQAICTTGAVEGTVSVTAVSGGSPDFTYILQDQYGLEIDRIGPTASTTETFSGVPVGNYTVVTLDANGCIDQDFIRVEDGDLDLVPDTVALPVCTPGGFTNTVTVVGGVGPFQIRLVTDPPGTFVPVNLPPDRHTFTGLQYGVTYTAEVLDLGTGCTHIETIAPIEGPNLDVTASFTPGYCDLRNGQIAYSVDNFTSGSDLLIEIYNVDTGALVHTQAENNVTLVPFTDVYDTLPGNYQVVVTNTTDDCSDGALITIDQNLPAVYIVAEDPANCNAEGQFTVVGGGGAGGPYEFAFGPSGFTPDYDGTSTPLDVTDDFGSTNTFGGPAGSYTVFVRDAAGCTSFDIATIIQLQTPPVLNVPVVFNQCTYTPGSDFQIVVSTPVGTDTPRFTMNGSTQFGVLNGGGTAYEATFLVSSPGNYPVLLEDADGCSSTGIAEVYEFLSASGEFTTEATCNDGDGVISITTTGGSGAFDFVLTGMDYLGATVGPISQANDPLLSADMDFTGMAPGTYEVTITDRIMNDGSGFCTFIVNNIVLEEAVPPVIDFVADQEISCTGADDGSIDVTLVAGSDVDAPIQYTLYETGTTTVVQQNGSGSFANLVLGIYDVVVLSDRGCEDREVGIEITEPPLFSITASAPLFACEPGVNRFSSTTITVGIVDPGTVGAGYQYSITGFSNYQMGNTFEIVDNGSAQNITVYAIDGNGCQTTFDVPTINPPTDVVPAIIEIDPLNCRDEERVRIQVLGTTDFTVNTVSVDPVPAVMNDPGNDYVDVYLPSTGDYLFEVTDNTEGCTYPLPVHRVNEPAIPTVQISEAKSVSCFDPGNDGALFITVGNYSGSYDYNVYQAADVTRTILLASGSFDTNDYPDVNGQDARIENLPGGNLIVDIVSTEMPYCSATSNVTNIRTPNGPLVVGAVPIGNVGCTNNTGEIEANGTGGWDNLPYEYRLMYSSDGGSTYTTEVVPFSNTDSFTNLAFGFYQVEIRDSELCTDTFEIELEEVPQIMAGIREPQGLDCPNGNNAVLEAYDTTSGDVLTATAGASGGVAGAGYNYTLLYLNSNDNTDVLSRSGLQNTPTFDGDSGGFISSGWYAIEVSSSFGCAFVTEPYFVDPPPPIAPLLVQTRVPGCGGDGQMRLTVENPDPLFTYEFAAVENGVVIGGYQPLPGNEILVAGVEGITYQFDVIKVNASGACPPVRSNGITMTNATGITLLPNLPDDISCASELDGRIESFVNGGVGQDLFYLYEGDPVDAFNPASTATLIRGPLPNGTFEGLPEGTDYFIAVTSGSTCMDIAGPFEIIRPDPIVFDAVASHVTCNGEEDGAITATVSSGGVGLIQFAIAPNFSEFFSDPDTPGTYTFNDLAAGTYEILIQDENGCFEKDFITIEEPDQLQVLNIRTTPELCIGANDGSVIFDISGGTPFNDVMVSPTPYFEYKIEMIDPVDESGTAVFAPYNGAVIENLQGGASYAIYVQDANLCSTTAIFTIGIGVDLTAEPQVDYGCEGIFPTSTATVALADSSVLPELLFALDPIDPTDAITAMATDQYTWGDLPAGDHTVYIYHENGCTNSVVFRIDPYEPLTLTVDKTGPNEVMALATGGYGDYKYFFNGESYGSETLFTTNESGMVNVRVIDAQGCMLELNVPFEFTGMLEFPNFFTPDGDNMNDEWSPKNRDLFSGVDVKIYDRYGRVVAILDEVSGWDGTYEGKEVPTGDYWYVVNANSNEIRYVGHFTLYR